MAVIAEIVTLSEAISYLGLGSTATDVERGRINFVKRGVEATVKRFLGTNILSDTYTHYLPRGNPYNVISGNCQGTSILHLKSYPVTSITSIFEDRFAYFDTATNAFAAATALTEGTDYYQELYHSAWNKWGRLYRVGTYWPTEPGSIKVTYVAGWTRAQLRGETVEPDEDASDLHQAILQSIAENWNEVVSRGGKGGATLGPVKLERFVDWSVEYDTENAQTFGHLSDDVRDKLLPFKRAAIVQ